MAKPNIKPTSTPVRGPGFGNYPAPKIGPGVGK
jgi:hypothetical protein